MKNKERYKGIGGWLLLYILNLYVLNLFFILSEISDLVVYELPAYFGEPSTLLHTLYITFTVSDILLLGFGYYVGLKLLVKEPNAVRFTQIYLAFVACYGIFWVLFPALLIPIDSSALRFLSFGFFVFMGYEIYYLIWSNYFEKSKRVKATYREVRCPECKRMLWGISADMIGNTRVCPKCKAEFTIGQEDTEPKDEPTQ
ncbi:DUF2569 family protein [Planctomycetota bacterium]